MATYNLRRFAQPAGLKAIEPTRLLKFLEPHTPYFASRGLSLSPPNGSNGLDYERLVEVLMSPDTDTPKDLVDGLFFVHEMSTDEGMDMLLAEAQRNGISLDGDPDPTAADVAVQVFLQDRELLERKHAERYLTRPRSFEYFQAETLPLTAFQQPSMQILAVLARDLDDWFEKKKRGRGSRVFVYPKGDSIWFLVRHGDPFRREGSLNGSESSSVFYRPEKYDVLVYEPALGELRMNACNKGEKETYRLALGRHIFGDEDFFPGTGKYSLEPLRTSGTASIVCTDVVGMDWVQLKEIQYLWGGAQREIEIRKADDIFAALEAGGRSLPFRARIIGASFQVKFTDAKNPRTVTIRPSNIAQYTRDSDADVVEDWLQRRGFIEHDEDEE